MSTLPPEPKTTGPYLASLQSLLKDKPVRMDCLVIAHNDPAMVRRLSEVTDENPAAILQVPQSHWDFEGGGLPEAVTWSLSEAGVKQLLLVGHSQAGPPDQSAIWIGDRCGESEPTQAAYDRLLDGAIRVQEQIQCSKHHFVQQVLALAGSEQVRDAREAERLQLHMLFYLAESGTFLLFDIDSETFKPLGTWFTPSLFAGI